MTSRLPAAAAALLVALTSAACGGSPEPSAAPAVTSTVTVTLPAETVTVPGPAQTTIKLPPVTKTVVAPPPAPVAAIEEGVWVVGSDIQPGTYRTIDPVSDGCYWGIYRGGTNMDDIIQNGTPTGGRPVVTLRKGQEFESNGCGSWAKR